MQLTRPRPSLWHRLARNRSGVAMIEFAFAGPVVMALGLYGAEMGTQSLTHMRISQITLTLADNASRMGQLGANNIEQMRDGDMNDVFQAARLQGSSLKLGTYGRVTISSLENIAQSYDTSRVQRIHWQRCMGMKRGQGFESSYGTTRATDGATPNAADAGTTVPNGMGDPGRMVSAPPDTGVIFVEVNYQYQPLVSAWLAKPFRMHYVASMIVRNNRDFRQIYNPLNSATPATCDVFAA